MTPAARKAFEYAGNKMLRRSWKNYSPNKTILVDLNEEITFRAYWAAYTQGLDRNWVDLLTLDSRVYYLNQYLAGVEDFYSRKDMPDSKLIEKRRKRVGR